MAVIVPVSEIPTWKPKRLPQLPGIELSSDVLRAKPTLAVGFEDLALGKAETALWMLLYEHAMRVNAEEPETFQRRMSVLKEHIHTYQKVGSSVEYPTVMYCVSKKALKKALSYERYSDSALQDVGNALMDCRLTLNVFDTPVADGSFVVEKSIRCNLLSKFVIQSSGVGVEYAFDPVLYYFHFEPKFERINANHKRILEFRKGVSRQLYQIAMRFESQKSTGFVHLPDFLAMVAGAQAYPTMPRDAGSMKELRHFISNVNEGIREINESLDVPYLLELVTENNAVTGRFTKYMSKQEAEASQWFFALNINIKEYFRKQEELESLEEAEQRKRRRQISMCLARAGGVYDYVDHGEKLKNLLDETGPVGFLVVESLLMKKLLGKVEQFFQRKSDYLSPNDLRSHAMQQAAGAILGALLKKPEDIKLQLDLFNQDPEKSVDESIPLGLLEKLLGLTRECYQFPWVSDQPVGPRRLIQIRRTERKPVEPASVVLEKAKTEDQNTLALRAQLRELQRHEVVCGYDWLINKLVAEKKLMAIGPIKTAIKSEFRYQDETLFAELERSLTKYSFEQSTEMVAQAIGKSNDGAGATVRVEDQAANE